MEIGVVGGGLMGLALAYRLTDRDHRVCVFERDQQLGGLATYHDFGPFVWDRFYHVILPSDVHLIRFIHDIGLGEQLRWQTTKTGFFVDQRFHSLSTSLEFLTFPPLGLWSKCRLALTILYCARINHWQRLEKVNVEDWLIRLSGRTTYEKMWKPLLLAKLGENYQRVSAVFIWSYIKRLFSARDSSAQKEQLGYVNGSYKTVFERLQQLLESKSGVVRTGVSVARVEALPDGRIGLSYDGKQASFDKVIITSPVNIVRQIVAPQLIDTQANGETVEYLGVICMVLITKTPLIPYYVLNIADPRIPFTGVIGMSNVVALEQTAGLHLSYVPKYVLSTDPLLKASEEALEHLFMAGLRLLFPNYDWEDLVSWHIHRAIKVQPLQVLDYSKIVPRVQTRHENLCLLNTAQFVNNTLNNNEVIRAVDEFVSGQAAFREPAR